ncbi:FG-GAP repeat domain-containing protein [Bacteroidota bacterium]
MTQTLFDENDWGYGTPALADFDKDGDLDFAVGVRDDSIYWYEFMGSDQWIQHTLSPLPLPMLGSVTLDVNNDGWEDLVTGGYWFKNSMDPKNRQFKEMKYDSLIIHSVHDIVISDINNDRKEDLVILSDTHGLFWYNIPDDSNVEQEWPRYTITLDVLNERDDIHGGFFPNGVADLDQDGDSDVVLPDRWLENQENGMKWEKHDLPFGKRGPWGLSSRSWISDIDQDNDQDIIMVDCDQKGSRAVWLESNGHTPPEFTVKILPIMAPGTRGSFHSLWIADFDNDGDEDIFAAEQEDDSILPTGAGPRAYIWENIDPKKMIFVERVIIENSLGLHDAQIGDVDGDGDLDICSKVWNLWPQNANQGRFHADFFENNL